MIRSNSHKKILKCLRVGWIGVGVVVSGCATNGSLTAEQDNSAAASNLGSYPLCNSPRTLQRDLSLNGTYKGVEQLYIQWDGTRCTL